MILIATVSAHGWYGGMRRDTTKERIERKEREKEKAKLKERKDRRKEERKARASATAGKETEAGGMSNVYRGGLNRFMVTVDTVGRGVTRKLNAICGKDDVHLQWYRSRHIQLSLTLDPLYRNVFKR